MPSTGFFFENGVDKIQQGTAVDLKEKEKHAWRKLLKSYTIFENEDEDENEN